MSNKTTYLRRPGEESILYYSTLSGPNQTLVDQTRVDQTQTLINYFTSLNPSLS